MFKSNLLFSLETCSVFHPKDLHRFQTDDRWVSDFIENNEYNMKNAFKQCCETLEWRKSFEVNGEENYLISDSKVLHFRCLFFCDNLTVGCRISLKTL